MRITARRRIDAFLDDGDRVELVQSTSRKTYLSLKTLSAIKTVAAQKATNEKDALVVMQGKLKGMPVVVACFEFMGAQWHRL